MTKEQEKESTETVNDTIPEAPKETTNGAQDVELTIQDLAGLKQIIDVASARGAFKPSEMVTIGQVYNKLDSFLSAIEKQQKAKQGA